MAQQELIQLFENLKIRVIWDDEQEKYFFSIVDIIRVLNETDYQTARKYWKVLKGRLQHEGFDPVTNCYQLKLTAEDGSYRIRKEVRAHCDFRQESNRLYHPKRRIAI